MGYALPLVRAAARALVDFTLPLACVSCEGLMDAGEDGLVCGRCWSRLALLPYPRCERCGHPTAGRACRWCALLPPFVRAARAVCWVPGGTAGAMVHALKYHGWTRAAAGMAGRMARLTWPRDVVEERAFVVPVPLAPVRLRERGYNQSALLADALANRWGIPARPKVLERVRGTRTQTRLTPDERRINVSGAFRAVESAIPELPGAHVVLVDDVITTAATMNACAAALLEGGARIVSYVTFGRAPTSDDQRGDH
ncbi:MAG: phosphoribosyltransferase family protein [Gemmatimonadaceae bacterium]